MKFSFAVSVETADNTGEVLAAYFRVRKGTSSVTKEFAGGSAFADYNRKGELLGIEILGPCKVSVIDSIASEESMSVRRQTKRFVKESGPRKLVLS